MESPKRHRPLGPTLSFNTSFSKAYVQTRHKNLRCFPVCAPVHMEKSFCGRIMEVTATFPKDMDRPTGKPMLVGEFRCTTVDQALNVGSTTDGVDLKDARYIIAELVVSGSGDLRFVINPNRKWFYPRTTSEGELHCYSVFLIMDNLVVAQLDSPSFKVLPIWKEERRPSMSGLKAGPKSHVPPSVNSFATEDGYGMGVSDSNSSSSSMAASPAQMANLAMQQYNFYRQQQEEQIAAAAAASMASSQAQFSWPSSMQMPMAAPSSSGHNYFRGFPQHMPPHSMMSMGSQFQHQQQFAPVNSALTAQPLYSSFVAVPSRARPPAPSAMPSATLPHFAPPSHRALSQKFLVSTQGQQDRSLTSAPPREDHARHSDGTGK